MGRARTPDAARIYRASGKVRGRDPFVLFLYYLFRDSVPSGSAHAALRRTEEEIAATGRARTITYSNGWTAKHAAYVARRLRALARRTS